MRGLMTLVLVAIATPAAAQFTSHPTAPSQAAPRLGGGFASSYGPSEDVYRQIRRERRAGNLSRAQARALKRQAEVNDAIAAREGDSSSAQAAAGFRNAALASQVKAAAAVH